MVSNYQSYHPSYVTREESLNIIKHLPKHKSPGPDGFSAEFFLATWKVIGPDVCTAVLSFINSSSPPRIVNSTVLALIPKAHNVSTMDQFRPIFCCNVLYKVLTKLLAQRMKDCMPDLISPNQVAFVKGRKLGEHILLAQALCKDYHPNSGAPKIAFKIDIAKALNTLN